MNHGLARRAGKRKLEIVPKILSLPKGQHTDIRFGFVRTFGHEGVFHLKRMRQMLFQRAKEFIARAPRRSLGDVPKRFFNPLAVGDVTNDDGCFGCTGMILIKGTGYFTKKCRAILALIETLATEAPGALPFFQKGLQSAIGRIHKSEPGDATDLFYAPSE